MKKIFTKLPIDYTSKKVVVTKKGIKIEKRILKNP